MDLLGSVVQADRSSEAQTFAKALAMWNEVASDLDLPKAQVLTEKRKGKLKARLQECGGLSGWVTALAKVRESAFLTGGNKQNWRADLDFMLQQSTFTKLMEGRYDNRTHRADATANGGRVAIGEDYLAEIVRGMGGEVALG